MVSRRSMRSSSPGRSAAGATRPTTADRTRVQQLDQVGMHALSDAARVQTEAGNLILQRLTAV
jgi:hypothetical protein